MSNRLAPLRAGISGIIAGVAVSVAAIVSAVIVVLSVKHVVTTPAVAPPEFPQLEAQYMKCINADKALVAAGQVMDNDMLFHCSAVSAQLQTLKFGGDFQKLHDWTNSHGR